MRVRHIKRTQNQAGQRVTYEASLHASNVMIIDPKTKKPTRIGYKVDEKTGKKTRIARASGEVITKAAAKVSKVKQSKQYAESKKVEKQGEAAPAAPAKTPFWKRGKKGGDGSGSGGDSGADVGANVIQTAHRAQGG